MKKFRDWPRARKLLLLSLVGLVVVLFGVYVFEAYIRVKSHGHGMAANPSSETPVEGETASPEVPVEPEEMEQITANMLLELEEGRNNRSPAPLAFFFRAEGISENLQERCGAGCLDVPVAPDLVLFLISNEGQMCRARTKTAFLWRGEAYEFPATGLELDKACEKIPEAEIAFFAMERPQFEKLRLIQPPEPSAETKESLEKLAPLHAKILAASHEAEGMEPLTEGFLPITPQESVLSVSEGPLKVRVHRWLETPNLPPGSLPPSEAMLRSGLLEYQIGDRPAHRLGHSSLLCGEIPLAFRLNGELHLLIDQYACNAGIRCRSFLRWRGGAFETVYGSCNFST